MGTWGVLAWPRFQSKLQKDLRTEEVRMNAKYTRNAQAQTPPKGYPSLHVGGVWRSFFGGKNNFNCKKGVTWNIHSMMPRFFCVSQHGGRGRWMLSYVAWVAGFACGVATTGAGDGA